MNYDDQKNVWNENWLEWYAFRFIIFKGIIIQTHWDIMFINNIMQQILRFYNIK